jgi:hypothetical protein
MTVRELIKILKEYDDNTVVTVNEYNGSEDLFREARVVGKLEYLGNASDMLKKRLKNHTPGAIYLSAFKSEI